MNQRYEFKMNLIESDRIFHFTVGVPLEEAGHEINGGRGPEEEPGRPLDGNKRR